MQFFVPIPWPLALFVGGLLLVARAIIWCFRLCLHAGAYMVGFVRGYLLTSLELRRARRPMPPVPVDHGGVVIDGEARRVDQ